MNQFLLRFGSMVKRGYRYRFYPTPEQEVLLRKTLGCVRLVYNKALADRQDTWKNQHRTLGYREQSARLTQWKKLEELAFLREPSKVPLQQTLRHLNENFARFFKKEAGYPRFKKRRHGGKAEFTRNSFTWREGQLTLAKMKEPLDIRWSRPLPKNAEPSTVTVSLDPAGRWHVSLLVEEVIKPLDPLERSIGIDLGLNRYATFSTGEDADNPRWLDRALATLKRAQQALSRKIKGSKNREKARNRVAKLHAQVTDQRQDFIHKLTTQLVRENQTIVIEDLSVKNMVKNRRLSRAISGAGWGELVRQLTYKCAWYGRRLIKIDRFFPSSKTCSSCGLVLEDLALGVRAWTCESCGILHDRDHNAARNILAAGLAVTACGDHVSPGSVSSEQAEVAEAGSSPS